MKTKTIKSFIATFLAAVIAFSCFSVAFAAGETLEWDFYGETYTYEYAGTLVEGENAIAYSDVVETWYDFNAQSAGFYKLSYYYEDADLWFCVPESFSDNTAYGNIGKWVFDAENTRNSLFYLEAGEQIIGVENYHAEHDATISIEYLGEEITSVQTAQETILDCDLYLYDEGDSYYYSVEADSVITFSSGKTITLEYLDAKSSDEIKKGENALTCTLFDKDYDFTVNVAFVEDYIESVEVSNIEDYLNVKEYYDIYDTYGPYEETLTVNFKDGTSTELPFSEDMFTMPNGSEIWYGYYYSAEDGKLSLNIYIGNTDLKSYECTTTPADFKENIEELKSNFIYNLEELSHNLRYAFISLLECDNIYDFVEYGMENSLFYLIWARESFEALFSETFNLIRYYIA